MPPGPRPDCWLHSAAIARPSPVAGRGLFAAAPIAEGTVVVRVGGRLVSGVELSALLAAAAKSGRPDVETVVVDEDVHLVLPPGRLTGLGNHGCDPNLWWADAYTLVARRDIQRDEEITSDYATSTADRNHLLRCNCGSPRCRGMITGDDWRIPELQRRYSGHWVPMLNRRIAAS